MNIERQTVTVPEAAKIIGLSHISLYAAIKKGEFTQVIRLGRRIVVPVIALEKYLANAGAVTTAQSELTSPDHHDADKPDKSGNKPLP